MALASQSEGRAEWSFAKLFNWHLDNGTRPKGNPDRPGERWTTTKFAERLGTDERNVRNWRNGKKQSQTNFNFIEEALFGDTPVYDAWKKELREAYRRTSLDPGPALQRPITGGKLAVGDIKSVLAAGWNSADLLRALIALDYEVIGDLTPLDEGDVGQWAPVFWDHPQTWRLVLEEPEVEMKIVGYWHFAPLIPKYFQRAKDGHLHDSQITADKLDYIQYSGWYDIYFTMIALLPQYRTNCGYSLLLGSLRDVITELAKDDTFFSNICTNAFTPQGKGLCIKFGLTCTGRHKDGPGEIFEGNFAELINHLWPEDSKLRDTYRNAWQKRNKSRLRFPLLERHYRMKMGLLPLSPSEWIDIDEEFVPQLSNKRALLTDRHDEVFQALPNTEAAGREILTLLENNILTFHGKYFERQGEKLLNKLTSEVWDLDQTKLHPLDLAGRLVQEDFCLLQSDGDGDPYKLRAATVCFPANWRLSEKIGRHLNAIHQPVPGYEENLAERIDKSFENLPPDYLAWRANWLIHGSPRLFQPGTEQAPTLVTAENAGDRLWYRSERQTLQRLPESRAVLFTIRTRVIPLRLAVVTVVNARDLAATIRTMPPATLQYRHMTEMCTDLLAWLDQH